MSDERLRDLYGAAVRRRSSQDAGVHPDPEALVALVRHEGDEAARLATLDHVMGCVGCKRDFDLLRTVERAGVESGGIGRTGGRRSWLMPAALAASLLLAVGLGRSLMTPDDTTRGDDASAIVLVLPAGTATTGGSVVFAWRPVPGATRYELEVLDAGGGVAAGATTADTTATPAGMSALPPGEYRWWVRATTSDAGAVRSTLRSLVLTAP